MVIPACSLHWLGTRRCFLLAVLSLCIWDQKLESLLLSPSQAFLLSPFYMIPCDLAATVIHWSFQLIVAVFFSDIGNLWLSRGQVDLKREANLWNLWFLSSAAKVYASIPLYALYLPNHHTILTGSDCTGSHFAILVYSWDPRGTFILISLDKFGCHMPARLNILAQPVHRESAGFSLFQDIGLSGEPPYIFQGRCPCECCFFSRNITDFDGAWGTGTSSTVTFPCSLFVPKD